MRSTLLLLVLAGCAVEPTEKDAEGVGAEETGAALDSAPADSGAPGEGEGEGEDSAPPQDSDTPAEGEGEGEEEQSPDEDSIRFVALGDAGEGNDTQYQVAAAMEVVCAELGCDFALYLGDNFYESGVDSVDDELWQTHFELPYAYLDFPFYAVLGNHDYGGNGAGYEYWKADYQVEYAETSDKWIMPDNYYSFTEGPADFFALDTNLVFWGFGEDQLTWLQSELAASTSPWKIVFGHHDYISNGSHGNAGNYEGLSWLPIVNGEAVQTFIEESVCGVAQVYICGHDHDRQWLEPTCGTEFLVSGAGAKTTEMEYRDDNPTYWDEDTEGFLWVELTATTFTGVFYSAEGVEEFRREITL